MNRRCSQRFPLQGSNEIPLADLHASNEAERDYAEQAAFPAWIVPQLRVMMLLQRASRLPSRFACHTALHRFTGTKLRRDFCTFLKNKLRNLLPLEAAA